MTLTGQIGHMPLRDYDLLGVRRPHRRRGGLEVRLDAVGAVVLDGLS
jgi:hypothetical protein